jgi:hypothetical protein
VVNLLHRPIAHLAHRAVALVPAPRVCCLRVAILLPLLVIRRVAGKA